MNDKQRRRFVQQLREDAQRSTLMEEIVKRAEERRLRASRQRQRRAEQRRMKVVRKRSEPGGAIEVMPELFSPKQIEAHERAKNEGEARRTEARLHAFLRKKGLFSMKSSLRSA